MSRLFGYELKKILSGAALWSFVVLCILFNIWAMPTHMNRFEFDTTTPFPSNVFENYDTGRTAEAYISFFELEGRVAQRMRAKYDALQTVVDQNAVAGYSYSPYFGWYTYLMHNNLFHSFGVVGRLVLQGILLAALLALLSVGYEQTNSTEPSVYATKTGRHILWYKIGASLTATVVLYALLVAVTLGVYFSIFDYSNVWGSSVSSGFNYIGSVMGTRPFVTWQSFTVATYLLASLGVSVVLAVCFALMGAIVGTLVKNTYVGFLAVVAVNAACMVMPILIPMNLYAHYISFYTPILLWLNSARWFTCGGFTALWRNFELWGAGISLAVLAILCIIAVKKFEKRNIV